MIPPKHKEMIEYMNTNCMKCEKQNQQPQQYIHNSNSRNQLFIVGKEYAWVEELKQLKERVEGMGGLR